MKGRIHSFQSLALSDGPGVRFGIFMQGCPNRCVYCHNPDTLSFSGGSEYEAREAAERALRCRCYFGRDGGVTVSGGEPLMQAPFVTELFSILKKEGVSTALDTSGIGEMTEAEELLGFTDTVLCDIKFPTEEGCREHCGLSLARVLAFLALTEKKGVGVIVRHVVVPGLTDSEDSVREIKRLASGFSNVRSIELLPFRKLCSVKYRSLGIIFPLENTPECSVSTLEKLQKLVK